jgi:hypothetical protein
MQNLNCPDMTAARRLFADALAASWKIFLRRMKHEAAIGVAPAFAASI